MFKYFKLIYKKHKKFNLNKIKKKKFIIVSFLKK